MATLELIRALHEEIERYQRVLVRELNRTPATLKVQTDQVGARAPNTRHADLILIPFFFVLFCFV